MLPKVKIGPVSPAASVQALAGPVRKLPNAALTDAEHAGQRELRVVERLRRADVGVGGDEVLLGLQDVGPPLEQRRRQVRRESRRDQLVDRLAARDRRRDCGPSRTAIRFSCAAICCSSAGIAASACWYCDWTCATSTCDTTPPLKRSSKIRCVSA